MPKPNPKSNAALQCYVVGGAVRDKLLQLPCADRDWVVIGASAQDLIARGFHMIDSDFQVFLHPKTREEYSLARKEVKFGHGYRGFKAKFSPDISLEQDLSRRDLTINAMAMTQSGEVIDPFNGQADLEQKILRHINEQFKADPLRVLRVARFAARFADMGFTIAEETLAMMREVSDSGELAYLTAERIWLETHKALQSNTPSVYFATLMNVGALSAALNALDNYLRTAKHALRALDIAAQLNFSSQVRYASLMHAFANVGDYGQWNAFHHAIRTPKPFANLAHSVASQYQTLINIENTPVPTIWTMMRQARLLNNSSKCESFIQTTFCIDYVAQQPRSKPSLTSAYEHYRPAQVLRKLIVAVENHPINLKARLPQQTAADSVRVQQCEAIKQTLHSLRAQSSLAYPIANA